jgi:hypothetical protein
MGMKMVDGDESRAAGRGNKQECGRHPTGSTSYSDVVGGRNRRLSTSYSDVVGGRNRRLRDEYCNRASCPLVVVCCYAMR